MKAMTEEQERKAVELFEKRFRGNVLEGELYYEILPAMQEYAEWYANELREAMRQLLYSAERWMQSVDDVVKTLGKDN